MYQDLAEAIEEIKEKGYIVAGTTIYRDREKAEFLDLLLQKNN